MGLFIIRYCIMLIKQLNVTKSEFTFSCYVYDKDHMSELRINNRSERDLRSCEVTNKK